MLARMMMTPLSTLSRRRFLTLSATACLMPFRAAQGAPAVTRWRGNALGAQASASLVGLSPDEAGPVLIGLERELRRLEEIFSLYRETSELSRLNAAGRLDHPAPELLAVLSWCAQLHHATDGAFDPTVQPLFEAWARAAAQERRPSEEELAAARARVGWDGVAFDAQSVRLRKAGAALTLNGIAQGYITDRITGYLERAGLRNVVVDMGEIAARGHRPDGQPWNCTVAGPDGARLKTLTLTDRAIATSAVAGMGFGPASGGACHLFEPATGKNLPFNALVSISAPTATLADGLSTALCVLPRARHRDVAARLPDTRIEVTI